MAKKVAGEVLEQNYGLQVKFNEFYRQINQKDGYPFDFEKLLDHLQDAVEGKFQINNKIEQSAKTVAPAISSFTVGEVFRHRDSNCIPQYHSDNFANWYAKPASKKVIPINFDGMKLAPEYVLPKDMNDSAIQKAAGSTPMSEQQFSLLLYSLIIKPELGRDNLQYELSKEKYYIFHVQLDSGEVVAFGVGWNGDERSCRAGRFDSGFAWRGGRVFVSFATVEI